MPHFLKCPAPPRASLLKAFNSLIGAFPGAERYFRRSGESLRGMAEAAAD
jgi:hypothetical protein